MPLLTVVTRLSLDAEPERLHLHRAALTLGDRGVLISARSGTGKSTLAAALALNGWSYGSDESVAIDLDTSKLSCFAKPLVIKAGGGDLVPSMHNQRVTLGLDEEIDGHTFDVVWVVPASKLGVRIEDSIRPACVVILSRPPTGSDVELSVLQRIHPADAVVSLMGQTMDAERFGPATVATLAGIASTCHCVALPIGSLERATTELEKLIAEEPDYHEVPC